MYIDIELFEKIVDSLEEMINYADDGMLNENDPMYSDFFDAIKRAKELDKRANELLEDEIVCKFD